MRINSAMLFSSAMVCLGVLLIGPGTGLTQTKEKTVEKVPITASEPGSGKAMYKDYCAVCHGADGKGGGPALEALKIPPPDLTTMAKRYNEKSIALRVDAVLRFGTTSKTHGTPDMPLWGTLFSSLDRNQQAVNMRISNLSQYIQALQEK